MLLTIRGLGRGKGEPDNRMPIESLSERSLVDRDTLSEVVLGRSLLRLSIGERLWLAWLPSPSIPSLSVPSYSSLTSADLLDDASG